MKRIFHFHEGSATMSDLLGGKGANLAEMTQLGLPVPPGFTITTESCIDYLKRPASFHDTLKPQIIEALQQLEATTGKSFDQDGPVLLVSVRSGAAISMPGMMDTILNLGLNDQRVLSLAQQTSVSFAFECYRRLMQLFGDVVYHIDKQRFDSCCDQLCAQFGKSLEQLSIAEHQQIITAYQKVMYSYGDVFPQDPYEQVDTAIQAVFKSWHNPRAKIYRELHNIPENLGTAVNVQAMVFGNGNEQSGTGVAFTRNPATGENALFGEFLRNAQGEDVVAGLRTPQPLAALAESMPDAYHDFEKYSTILERHYRDMQDIEFTIENGELFILQTRQGKRTAKAALKIACDLVDSGLINEREALMRVSPDMIGQLLHPVFEQKALDRATPLAKGLPASPGAATGQVVFTAEQAKQVHGQGKAVILVRQETSPEDIEGMIISEAIVTSRGGMTSHAAVVARGMGTCCVTGCETLTVNEQAQTITCGDHTLTLGDQISVDGTSGMVYIGDIPTVPAENDENLLRILDWADKHAQLKVRANAETVHDIQTAIQVGASGIGLSRTEHMFFGEERLLEMRRLILAEDDNDINDALKRLLHFQEEDFYQMFQAAQERPLVIRLLDPPMHEFLPHEAKEIAHVAKQLNKDVATVTKQIQRLQETNPMLGHRGCRLSITEPRIYQMQVTAIFNSAIRCAQEGLNVLPEVMIPLIAEKKELTIVKQSLRETIQQVFAAHHLTPFPYEIGTMIELPRACLIADQLALEADFFSFGTNDLTQMTFGFSRDDIGKFINHYQEQQILTSDPFQHLDQEGVGALIRLAVEKGRQTKPHLTIGICGEVGGDPQSIPFLQSTGIDYVSCSPYRIPAARLAVAQAAIQMGNQATKQHVR